MTTSVETVLDSFPKQTITPIEGLPTYETIKLVNDELSANAASVHSTLGGGNHGYLGITVTTAVYATISNTAFASPTMHTQPNTAGLTGPQISALNRAYDANVKKFREYCAVEGALKKQLLVAVDDIYLEAIKERYIAFGNKTLLDLLTHLYATYAKITPADLAVNRKKMSTPWDPNLPIEYVFRQIQDAMVYASHAQTPFSNEQIVNEAYTIVFNTGLFENKCRKWRKRTRNVTWVYFKTYFGEAYNDWRESQKTTAASNYSTANMTTNNKIFEEENIAAIANLATATAADRATTAQLTATNAQLTTELKRTQDKLVEALERLERFSKQITKQPLKQRDKNTVTRPLDRHYCWTHGYLCEHTSGRFPDPKQGHCKFATARKPLNGSKINKEECIKRVTHIDN